MTLTGDEALICLLQLASGSFCQAYYVSGPGRCVKRSSRLGAWDRFHPLMASSWSLLPPLSPGLKHCPGWGLAKRHLEQNWAHEGGPATAPQCAQLHSQCMWWKPTSLSKWPSAEQYLPIPFRAGPWPQSLLFRLSGFSAVQLIHAWLTDVAGGVYGHDRCFLLSSAIVCRELI